MYLSHFGTKGMTIFLKGIKECKSKNKNSQSLYLLIINGNKVRYLKETKKGKKGTKCQNKKEVL